MSRWVTPAHLSRHQQPAPATTPCPSPGSASPHRAQLRRPRASPLSCCTLAGAADLRRVAPSRRSTSPPPSIWEKMARGELVRDGAAACWRAEPPTIPIPKPYQLSPPIAGNKRHLGRSAYHPTGIGKPSRGASTSPELTVDGGRCGDVRQARQVIQACRSLHSHRLLPRGWFPSSSSWLLFLASATPGRVPSEKASGPRLEWDPFVLCAHEMNWCAHEMNWLVLFLHLRILTMLSHHSRMPKGSACTKCSSMWVFQSFLSPQLLLNLSIFALRASHMPLKVWIVYLCLTVTLNLSVFLFISFQVIKSLHGNIVVQLLCPDWFLLSSMMPILRLHWTLNFDQILIG